ncbi:MAG: HAD family hydrolase [Candidatus Helarchaeota archaeon]
MNYKLVCFDLDGCLTERDDSWSFIHRELGVWEQAKKHRKLFFEGKIDYQQWADLDVGLWKGTPITKLNKVIKQIKVRPHLETVIQELKKRKVLVIIISSGLSFFADRIKEEFGFDFAIANTPIIGENGKLTGECDVKVKYDDKHEVLDFILNDILVAHNIKPKECIAVGDGENDIPLFKKVGYSIAFNPLNENVANSADVVVKNGGLLDVLSIILSKL